MYRSRPQIIEGRIQILIVSELGNFLLLFHNFFTFLTILSHLLLNLIFNHIKPEIYFLFLHATYRIIPLFF